jgi:hypothetical protein
MASLTEAERKRLLEQMKELEKRREPQPGHKSSNPDKFSMPVTPPKTPDGYSPEGGNDKEGEKGKLSEEQRRELEEMKEAARRMKAPPGHKIHNPDKFTMPLTEPESTSELTKEQKDRLEQIEKLKEQWKPRPGHESENPDKFTMAVTEPKKDGDRKN